MPWAELNLYTPWGGGGKGRDFSAAVTPCIASHLNVSVQVGFGESIGWVGGGKRERSKGAFYSFTIYSFTQCIYSNFRGFLGMWVV